jgi:uncharacterized protein
MITYFDTSSLVKLYIEESGSEDVFRLLDSSEAAATSIVAYAESRAAFSRRFREKAIKKAAYHRLVEVFNRDWNQYAIVNTSKELAFLAGDLAVKHGLRGFDAIHLASALLLTQDTGMPIRFSCYDSKLNDAAGSEGLVIDIDKP